MSSTSAAAKGGVPLSHQESPDSGVSAYEEVPENLDAYDDKSREGEGENEQNADEGEESGTLQDEAMSEASSLASEGAYSLDYRDLVDIMKEDLCMALMKHSQGGVKIPCICGNIKKDCIRVGHQAKQQRQNGTAPPCFYARFPGKKGMVDGRLDRPAFTAEEVHRIL
jgi:hypothetical protein